jgi:hypothetical protein
MSDDTFDPAQIANQHRAADDATREAAQRARGAQRLRDEALRALCPLQAHTNEAALNEALDDPDPAAAPKYRETWASLVLRFGRALEDAHLAGRLPELAPESDGDKFARAIVKAACSGEEKGVRELLNTAWDSRSLVHSVNSYLRDVIPDKLLYSRPLDGQPVPVEATPEGPPAAPEQSLPRHPTLFKLGEWDLTESGYATYIDTRFPLSGAKRRLLARLIRGQGRPVHADHLIDDGNLNIDRTAIAPYITRLRNHLRTYLPAHIPEACDPIPYRDPDAYELTLR